MIAPSLPVVGNVSPKAFRLKLFGTRPQVSNFRLSGRGLYRLVILWGLGLGPWSGNLGLGTWAVMEKSRVQELNLPGANYEFAA